MKRYILFTGYDYYPSGGANDFRDSFDDLTIAIAYAKGFIDAESMRWAHVLDTQTGQIIWSG